MKKILYSVLTFMLIITLTACSQKEQSENTVGTSNETSQTTMTGDKILVVYFGVMETDGVDTVAGASRVAIEDGVIGNTKYIANIITSEVNGDEFEIQTIQKYPETHDELLEFAHEEKNNDDRPILEKEIEDFDQYDIVFIGYPVWNADLPMPLYTFLESYDFSGKTIIPFITHGGSSFSGTIETIASLQPNATVVSNGLSISRNNVSDSDAAVKLWIEELEIKKGS